MTPTLETTSNPAADSEIRPHRFTGAEFRRMYELGLVPRRSQLIRGEIYFMVAMGAAHADAITVLTELLVQGYSAYARVSPQCPITIWNDSQPEPDFALVKRDAPKGIAFAKDVLLAIEVSDSSLKFDRQTKLPDYARSGIPEVWILNLNDGQLEVYHEPDGEQYLQIQVVKPAKPVAPLFAADRHLEWWLALPEAKTEE